MQLNMHCCFGHIFEQSEQGLWSLCRKSSNKDVLITSWSLWKDVCLENSLHTQCVDQEKVRTSQPISVQEKMHVQQKALMLQYFFIPKRCVLSHVCNPSVWYFLNCLPLYDLYTTLYLWHSVCPNGLWMLYCTVCRTILIKLQCLTWIVPLPYWEVFRLWFNVCNVFIVLWPIGVVA